MGAGRPAGIALIAIVLAANGLASLVEALWVAWAMHQDAVRTLLSTLTSLALLHRSYALWNYRRGAWTVTVLLIGVRIILAVLGLLADRDEPATWIDLGVGAVTFVYLIQPSTRALFAGKKTRA